VDKLNIVSLLVLCRH